MAKIVSLGIMAFNEEANIDLLLRTVHEQTLGSSVLFEIIVVASGCTDRTEEIAHQWEKKDDRIKLLVQPVREGKASAINLFLSTAVGNILILESADTLPEPGTLEQIIAAFDNPSVGMVGGRPVPVNGKQRFIGFAVHLMWTLHHHIALQSPKLGELVAFRNCIKHIPKDTAVDEACIEAAIRDAGFLLHYIPEAIVRNKGPENVSDFIKQRRRIAAGHQHLYKEFDYKVSTTDPIKILRIIIKNHTWRMKETLWTSGAIGLEIIGRALGYYDFYICKKDHCVWDIACSTKCIEE